MKGIAYLFLLTGVLAVTAGMLWGIHMAISGDHTLAPAHAHLNLVGFVVMTIYAIYYALTPAAASSTLAKVHYALGLITVLIFAPGIALANLGKTEALAAIGSLFALATMLVFLFTVLRHGFGRSN